MPCNQIQDDLAGLVEGDDAVIARHADHLASCDDCRDARYEAGKLARAIAAAGDDHVATGDLAERLLARLDVEAAEAATVVAPAPAPAPMQSPITLRGH